MDQEFRGFMREVTDRLARMEVMLQGAISANKAEIEGCKLQHEERFKSMENEINELKEGKLWLWRAVAGFGLLAAYEFFKGAIK